MHDEAPPTSERRGARFGQLLSLLALTGFAISQPVLAVAGEHPTVFTFAGMEGRDLVVFALVVALVPPLSLWLLVLAAGRVRARVGDALFVAFAALLAGAAAAQWALSGGLDARWARIAVGAVAGLAFAALLVKAAAVRLWTRYAAPLPALAVILFLAASPASGLLSGPGRATAAAGDHPPVLFIMLDELPLVSLLAEDGSIDEVRFPNLAALADTSTWYRNYTVLASGTEASIPSILSGREPGGGPPIWTSHPDNLFTLLAPTHHLVVSETLTRLCGFDTCQLEGSEPGGDGGGTASVLEQMVDVWRQRVGLLPGQGPDLGQFAPEVVPLGPDAAPTQDDRPDIFDVAARPAQATAFMDALGRSAPNSLAYVHLMLPHQPWQFAPDGRPFRGITSLDLVVDGDAHSPWTTALMQQSHLFQAEYADRLVGEVLQVLRDTGRFDETLVVVTADHGIAFTEEGPSRDLREDRITQVAYVPLFVKVPGQDEGVVDDSNLLAVDLLPTLADLLGVEIPWEVAGHPAGQLPPERGGRKVIHDFNDGQFVAQPEPQETYEYDLADHRPSADLRLVGPVEAGQHPLAGLLRALDADHWLGVPVEELGAAPATGQAELQGDLLVGDPEGAPAGGVLSGSVPEGSVGGTVLLAIDGVVESAAPVDDDGRFRIMVRPGAPRGEGTEVRLFQVDGDRVVEHQVRFR